MLIDYFLANTDKFIAIFALIITSILTRYTVSLNYQPWVKTFSGSMTLLLLPIITFSITSVISGNIALSLGMIGALSIVRFRNPVRSSFELVIFFFMISLGICAAVDLRWLIILGFSCNFLLWAIYFFNSMNKKLLDKDLFIKSFSEGNTLNVLEISSSVHIQELFDSPLLASFSATDNNYIFRLASEDKKLLLKISEAYLDQDNILEIKYLTG
ncbi:MAG: DUF4956 domain-containing protein [Pelagibacterales bacterium]|jgi:hypothetical protein|nr:DUF4956 domain-containing protein [Pelagibacterales bacterium]